MMLLLARAAVIGVAMMLVGCASSGPYADERDPLEPWNRKVYSFNESVDAAVVKPLAQGYVKVTPVPVRKGVHNFFSHWGDLWSAFNAAFQLRGEEAIASFMRFNVNTVLGLGGLVDVATEMQIERRSIDFGHTLGYWGVSSGPYLVLPVLGASSVRDVSGFVVDSSADALNRVSHVPTRNTLKAIEVVDVRAQLLQAGKLLDEVALDKYSLTRDFYLNRRQNKIARLQEAAPVFLNRQVTPDSPERKE
jgi:phospholipid-binding lipoprotein MlaA